MASLEVVSNLKQITSGTVPTTATLANGEFAYGLIDGKPKLYGNTAGVITDYSNFLTTNTIQSITAKKTFENGSIRIGKSEGPFSVAGALEINSSAIDSAPYYTTLVANNNENITVSLPHSPGTLALTAQLLTQSTYTATLPSASWTGSSAPYTKAVTVGGILATDVPDIDLDLSSVAYANIAAMQTDWAKVYKAVTSANTITFFASEVPSADIKLKIKVVR